ncbi:Uncharacterized protein HZ326_17194 [Fusarium oxysporum f. sp. albedinis]|nr:Uncharacterized protein HZ326_17194 [Fusarium oxysporum f. sp. albedinis]
MILNRSKSDSSLLARRFFVLRSNKRSTISVDSSSHSRPTCLFYISFSQCSRILGNAAYTFPQDRGVIPSGRLAKSLRVGGNKPEKMDGIMEFVAK